MIPKKETSVNYDFLNKESKGPYEFSQKEAKGLIESLSYKIDSRETASVLKEREKEITRTALDILENKEVTFEVNEDEVEGLQNLTKGDFKERIEDKKKNSFGYRFKHFFLPKSETSPAENPFDESIDLPSEEEPEEQGTLEKIIGFFKSIPLFQTDSDKLYNRLQDNKSKNTLTTDL